MYAEDWLYLDSTKSEYYVYTPSQIAKDTYLYPIQIGSFSYLPGYHLSRDSFDSFLILYVKKGSLHLIQNGNDILVPEDYCMLIDCYDKHEYFTDEPLECIWMHFDGIIARPYYNRIIDRLGNVFTISNTLPIYRLLNNIFTIFTNKVNIQEALISKYITDIFTELLISNQDDTTNHNYIDMSENTISFINEHFAENITIELLASRAGLSTYHFIRSFKKSTGYTPHEYLINTRMSNARFLLSSTQLSIKDICYSTGFSSESVFCAAFKKSEGKTPVQYRLMN